jgi:hypothetical protein
MGKVICYIGGEARGNPGVAVAVVYIATEDGTFVSESAQNIGNATSDFTYYYAAMTGLQSLVEIYGNDTKVMDFEVRLDNELVEQQLNAESPITDPGLVPMFIEIHNMRILYFSKLTFVHISSSLNTEVKRLVAEVLDGK